MLATLWALAAKDIRLLLRDRVGAAFTFLVPLLFALFFGVVFSSGGDGGAGISLVVVDEDQSPGSRALVDSLSAAPELRVTESSLALAAESVRHGDDVAYLVLPAGFGQARSRILLGQAPQVQLGIDPARRAEAGMLEGVLTAHVMQTLTSLLTDPGQLRPEIAAARLLVGADPRPDNGQNAALFDFLGDLDQFVTVLDGANGEGSGSAVTAEGSGTTEANGAGPTGGFTLLDIQRQSVTPEGDEPDNAFAVSFPQGVVWGLIACVTTFATSLVSERTKGTLVRLRVAPISRRVILLGKAVACLAVTVSVALALFLVAVAFFSVSIHSVLGLVAAVVSAAVCFTGLMMLLAVLAKTERVASGMGWVVMMVMSMFGGGMVPLFVLPGWMGSVSHFSPVKWAILGFEGALWRGFSLSEMILPCGVLLGVGLAGMIAGIKAFRFDG